MGSGAACTNRCALLITSNFRNFVAVCCKETDGSNFHLQQNLNYLRRLQTQRCGGAVVSTVATQPEVSGFKVPRGLFCVASCPPWVLSGSSKFFTQSTDMHLRGRWLSLSPLTLHDSESVNACLSLYFSAAMSWPLVQGVPRQ